MQRGAPFRRRSAPPASTLQDEIQRLRDRVCELEELLGLREIVPPGLGLSPTESHLLGLLMRREIVSPEGALVALYDTAAEDRPSADVIKVWIWRLNRRLCVRGVFVRNEFERGYYLSRDGKDRLRRLFDDMRSNPGGYR